MLTSLGGRVVRTAGPPTWRTIFGKAHSRNVVTSPASFITIAKGAAEVLLAITSVSACNGIALAREG